MKNYIFTCLALLLISSPMAFADGKRDGHGNGYKQSQNDHKREAGSKHYGGGKHSGTKGAHSVPEIDTAGAAIAFALIAGLVAVRRERRTSK